MLDDLLDLLHVLFYLLACAFFMMALPFIICHVAEHWDDPIFPHSGFRPDSPAAENTLPPTYP